MAKQYNKPWRYALAMLGTSIAGTMYQSYGTYFYTDKLFLPLSAIAVGNIFFAVWDAFNDPIAGVMSDRTRTKWGRRKPWLMAAIPAYTLFSILFFNPPRALGVGAALAAYFTVTMMLTETAGTITNVNYHSLLPELFRDTRERNRANSIRQALQLVGMIIGVSLVPTLAGALGYPQTALLLGVISCAALLYAISGCRERQDFQNTPQPGLVESLKSLASNRGFWFVSVSHFFYQACSGLLLAGIPFFIKYSLGLPDSSATFLSASVFVMAIPAMAVWYRAINRFGALAAWRAALIWLGLSLVPMYFARSLVPACVVGAFVGVGIAGVTANLDMINSELIEADARKHGVRREATFFAGISFVTRVSSLARTGVFFMLSAIFGFVSGSNPGANPAMASRYMMVVFPICLMAFSVAASMFARFDGERG
ncbi:MAG: MFS transporter [Oscillospiraceae bacterium]|jgi:GPH family glycoside/pentoside/hexuronide:cation symporter|nr:MFS transporter [Oscillospiraceae bacterium]